MTYEKGIILYRVRAIGRNSASPEIRLEGSWSCSSNLETGYVDDYVSFYPNQIHRVTSSLEEGINWSAIKTYAENGKKENGVSYMDGVLHQRQNRVKLNTEEKTIVEATLYDFQGRPTISTLPAVQNTCSIEYSENLNLVSAGVPYDKNIFDNATTAPCNNTAIPMDAVNSTGAANYYSVYNTNKNAQQSLIPDANGYPFVQFEFYPDQTGRVKRQSLPGATHKFDGGHETKFAYLVPKWVLPIVMKSKLL
jgi:hypothetical protein